MKKLLSFLAVVLISAVAMAQSVILTFTANHPNYHYVQLNRVTITNLTKGWQETIYWPDTTLIMQNEAGINDVEMHGCASLQLLQNNPNPFTCTTEVNLTVAEEDEVMLDIMDINGKTVGTHRMRPQAGIHQFRITLFTAGTYVMTARQNGKVSSIKMVCNGGGDGNRIEYTGNGGDASHASESQLKNNPKYTTTNPFNFGDQMEYVGYATINGTEVESMHITQLQNVSQTIYLYFALDGQPCFDTPTVTDIDGNIYNTVQIGNQCWMKENLRTTHYANGATILLGSSTSTTTPYRYNPCNDASNVPTYGYLYNWLAVMHGASSTNANPSGVQGVCPNGWHVPSESEWTQLTDYVSSQTQYQCNNSSDNIAKALASTTGWVSSPFTCAVGNNPSTNNAIGFSVLPAGGYYGNSGSNDSYFGWGASLWSTTEGNLSIAFVSLGNSLAFVDRLFASYYYGLSVRCLRGDTGPGPVSMPTVTTNTVSSITTTSATCGGNVTSDGGATVIARGVCWSTSQNPTVSDSHTSDGSGTGNFTSSMTGLFPNTIYYVMAYAINSVGTAYGSQMSFTTYSIDSTDGQPCQGIDTITDIDDNTYNTVKIGNQCWMKENLRTTRYANGDTIPMGSIFSSTDSYRFAPNNDSSNVSTYGYLYNWAAVMHGASSSSANPSGVQGICPNGWHVPSDAEWTQLTSYVSSQTYYWCDNSSDNIAKALASTTGWNSSTYTCSVGNNPGTNNAIGFSALPASYYDGNYHSLGNEAYLWSATEASEYGNDYLAYYRLISRYLPNVRTFNWNKGCGLSVRCLRD